MTRISFPAQQEFPYRWPLHIRGPPQGSAILVASLEPGPAQDTDGQRMGMVAIVVNE